MEEKPQDYRKRAAKLERLADRAETDAIRTTLLYVAARWRAMAAADETRLERLRRLDRELPAPGT